MTDTTSSSNDHLSSSTEIVARSIDWINLNKRAIMGRPLVVFYLGEHIEQSMVDSTCYSKVWVNRLVVQVFEFCLALAKYSDLVPMVLCKPHDGSLVLLDRGVICLDWKYGIEAINRRQIIPYPNYIVVVDDLSAPIKLVLGRSQVIFWEQLTKYNDLNNIIWQNFSGVFHRILFESQFRLTDFSCNFLPRYEQSLVVGYGPMEPPNIESYANQVSDSPRIPNSFLFYHDPHFYGDNIHLVVASLSEFFKSVKASSLTAEIKPQFFVLSSSAELPGLTEEVCWVTEIGRLGELLSSCEFLVYPYFGQPNKLMPDLLIKSIEHGCITITGKKGAVEDFFKDINGGAILLSWQTDINFFDLEIATSLGKLLCVAWETCNQQPNSINNLRRFRHDAILSLYKKYSIKKLVDNWRNNVFVSH